MLTVLMATHNGADTLGRTLEAFSELQNPSGGWKLIIVDNASTDATARIIESWRGKLPLLPLREERLGKNCALNTGLAEIEGDFVVLCDDDVLPDPSWLREWRRVADAYPELAMFGGTIVPEFEVPPPAFCTSDVAIMAELWSATRPNQPEGAKPDSPIWDVYGCNMALRAYVARAFRFDEQLMTGPQALLGDESEFVSRVAEAGHKVGFAPSAKVRHLVGANQVTWPWMLRRFHRFGRSRYHAQAIRQPFHDRALLGAPRWLFRPLLRDTLRLPIAAASFDSGRVFACLRSLASHLGGIRQARVMARERICDGPPAAAEGMADRATDSAG
ncbi:MAG: glycosyltransferase family 2 protein [Acetobacteraceae bacterium]|nr:glycosyltransferase family 2 protein [Acetobacteraceae bacterium]